MPNETDREGRPGVRSASAKRPAKERGPAGPRTRPPPRRQPSVPRSGERRESDAEAAAEAMRELEISRQRYADLYDLAPVGYATLDRYGVIRQINLAGAAIFGGKRQSVAGRPLSTMTVTADRRRLRQHLARCFREPAGTSVEVRLLGAGGGERLVRVTSTRVVGVDGEASLLTTLVDFSQERQAAWALERERALLEATLRQAADGVVVCDVDGNTILVNGAARRIAGLDPESGSLALSEECWGRAFLPDGTPLPRERWPITLALRGERTTGRDLHMVPHGRRSYDLQISATPVRDATGSILAAVATFSDTTERARLEAAARRRQAWEEAMATIGVASTSGYPLQEVLQVGLVEIVRASGATVGLVRLLDLEARELVVAAQHDVPPEFLDRYRRIPRGTGVSGRVVESGEAVLVGRLPAGPQVSYFQQFPAAIQSLACLPLRTRGRVIGNLTLGHAAADFFGPADLPILAQAGAMLAGAVLAEQLRDSLRREAEERALLLRELDHRVRNILATLIGLLHLTAEHQPTPTADILRTTADRVARLADVHAVLAEHRHARADLGQLAEAVAKSVLDLMEPPGRIRWSVAAPPIQLRAAQATNLALALHELMTNCAKHAFVDRAAGTVGVEARWDGATVGVEVCDDGRGPGPDGIRPGGGFGIVEALVTHTLRGSFWVAEARGGGTLVYLRFPVDAPTHSGEPT